jgi:hypothetical protein
MRPPPIRPIPAAAGATAASASPILAPPSDSVAPISADDALLHDSALLDSDSSVPLLALLDSDSSVLLLAPESLDGSVSALSSRSILRPSPLACARLCRAFSASRR